MADLISKRSRRLRLIGYGQVNKGSKLNVRKFRKLGYRRVQGILNVRRVLGRIWLHWVDCIKAR